MSVDPAAGFVCEEGLVVNILWLIILVVRVDRPTDCQCYYCCLSAVVMKRTLFQMSHTNFAPALQAEQKHNILTTDLCEKTNVLYESIDLKESRCFTLTCTVHVISCIFGTVVQL